MAENLPARFRVLLSGAQSDRLKELAGREEAAGRKATFLAALRELDFRLTVEADEWGESRETLHELGLEIRVGAVGRLTVWYGVDRTRRVVYVKKFRLRGEPP